MKNKRIILRVLVAGVAIGALPLGACKKKPETPPTPAASYSGGGAPSDSTAKTAMDRTRDAAANAADAIADGTASAWADLKDATYDERLAFRDGVNRLSDNVDARLTTLKQRGGELSADGMEKLRVARENLKQKLNDLGNTSAANWDKARAAVADAWNQVEESFRNLEQKMRS